MDLVQFDPFSLLRDVDRLFTGTPRPSPWLPRIDVLDGGDRLIIRAELPGMHAEAVDVTVEARTLVISGERRFEEKTQEGAFHRREIQTGEFRRTLVLPEGMNPEEITAGMEGGILEISIPRRPEVLPRKVKVAVSD